jgi:hypothetical protein
MNEYLSVVSTKYNYLKKFDMINALPLSLKTEISMHFYEGLVQKVWLFELGDPSFILSILRHLRPAIFMFKDFITRKGEMAFDMYFIS